MSLISPMRRIQHIHFVGIGGAGMAGIAEVLHNQNYVISGSDIAENEVTQRLESLGIKVIYSHQADNINHVDVVVKSTAINDDNPELEAARQQHIPIVPRAEMLAELMRFRHGIAVAGTHGKTTTTSLVASLLAEGGKDPTFVIGGLLNSIGCNARLGAGEYLVAEADESDASFLYLQPMTTIVTNIDADHLSNYNNSFTELKNTFLKFLHHLPFYGLAVVCADDENITNMLNQIARPMITYGFNQQAEVQIKHYKQEGLASLFELYKQGKPWLQLSLNMPGRHNVLNATAAIIVASELGVEAADIKRGLMQFSGVGRRLQLNGELAIDNGKVLLIDDYGHHPTEIQATVEAIKSAWPQRRLVVAFQPHRYSRTQTLFEDFVRVLADLDLLMLLEVYPAGESAITGADSRALCRAIRQRGQLEPIFISDFAELDTQLKNLLKPDDILLTLGAGSIGNFAQTLSQQVVKDDD